MSEPTEEDVKLLEYLEGLAEAEKINKLSLYAPYPKQAVFHKLSLTVKERLLLAGNQTGKTWCGAYEMAMHLTGEYPEWWEGRRFDTAIVAIVGSKTAELTRDGVQKYLVGPPETEADWGTGTIPKASILDRARRQGVANALDSISVRHKSGATSRLLFKSYDQGRQKWQANTAHVVWFDEEPDMDVYSEGYTRTVATDGLVFMTFTPLLGRSEVVLRFLNEPSVDRQTVTMTMDDAAHFNDPVVKARALAGYPDHERDARAQGVPVLGSGKIFTALESSVVVEPRDIPRFFKVICGLDIGIDHPTGAAWLAYDADTDTIYVYNEYRASDTKIAVHASAIRHRGPGIPIAWPHDAARRDSGSGDQIAVQFRREGLNMLPEHSTWPKGGISMEAGIMEMQNREETGRLKYFSNCVNILEERRFYHRENGLVVKEKDDLLSALRMGIMMIRYARPLQDVGIRGKRGSGSGMAKGIDYNFFNGGDY